jgi:hypothetical protein
VVNIGAFVADVYTGDGDDRVYSLSVGGQKIDLANGNDYLEAYGGVNIIYGGYWGDEDITVGGGLNVVQVGHGNSTVRAYGGANVVLTGQGNNTVTADGGANVLLNGNGRYNANELCVCRHAKPQTPSRWSARLPSQKQICANHSNTSRQDGTNIGHHRPHQRRHLRLCQQHESLDGCHPFDKAAWL